MSAPRRWFQFSIRAVLVLILVVAAYFAGFATSEKLAEKAMQEARERAAAEVQAARDAEVDARQQATLEAEYRAATQAAVVKQLSGDALTKLDALQ